MKIVLRCVVNYLIVAVFVEAYFPLTKKEDFSPVEEANAMWKESSQIMRKKTIKDWDNLYTVFCRKMENGHFVAAVEDYVPTDVPGAERNNVYTDVMKVISYIAPVKQAATQATADSISEKLKEYSFMFLLAAFTVWSYEGKVSPLVARLAHFAANPDDSWLSKTKNNREEVVGIFDWAQEQDNDLLTKWMVILWAMSAGDSASLSSVDDGSISLIDYLREHSINFARRAEGCLSPEMRHNMVPHLERTPFETIVSEKGPELIEWINGRCMLDPPSDLGLYPLPSAPSRSASSHKAPPEEGLSVASEIGLQTVVTAASSDIPAVFGANLPPEKDEDSSLVNVANFMWGKYSEIMGIKTTEEWDDFYTSIGWEQVFNNIFVPAVKEYVYADVIRAEDENHKNYIRRAEKISFYNNVMKAKKLLSPRKKETAKVYKFGSGGEQTVYWQGGSKRQASADSIELTRATDESISETMKEYSFVFLLAAFSVWCYAERFTPLVARLAHYAANPDDFLLSKNNREEVVGIFDWTQEEDNSLLTKWMVILWALSAGDSASLSSVDDGSISLIDYLREHSINFARRAEGCLTPEMRHNMVSHLEHTPFEIIVSKIGPGIIKWIEEGCEDDPARDLGLYTSRFGSGHEVPPDNQKSEEAKEIGLETVAPAETSFSSSHEVTHGDKKSKAEQGIVRPVTRSRRKNCLDYALRFVFPFANICSPSQPDSSFGYI